MLSHGRLYFVFLFFFDLAGWALLRLFSFEKLSCATSVEAAGMCRCNCFPLRLLRADADLEDLCEVLVTCESAAAFCAAASALAWLEIVGLAMYSLFCLGDFLGLLLLGEEDGSRIDVDASSFTTSMSFETNSR